LPTRRSSDLYGLLDALAQVTAGIAVTEFDGLEGARGGAGRDGGTTRAAVVEADLDLDRGAASGVQDFPGYDDVDGRHEHLLLGCDAWAGPRWLCETEPNRLRAIGHPAAHPMDIRGSRPGMPRGQSRA